MTVLKKEEFKEYHDLQWELHSKGIRGWKKMGGGDSNL
jgi:hypothetical protein